VLGVSLQCNNLRLQDDMNVAELAERYSVGDPRPAGSGVQVDLGTGQVTILGTLALLSL
jgi:hypothetical protein